MVILGLFCIHSRCTLRSDTSAAAAPRLWGYPGGMDRGVEWISTEITRRSNYTARSTPCSEQRTPVATAPKHLRSSAASEMFSIKDTGTRNNTQNRVGEELEITRVHLRLSTAKSHPLVEGKQINSLLYN